MKTLKIKCRQCGKIVYRSPSSMAKFCSHKCYSESMKGVHKTPIKYCKYCGGEIRMSQKRKSATKYCSQKCYFQDKKKSFIVKKGYKKILIPSHPRADGKGYVFEHIIILEHKLGRPLKNKEVTHHIDGDKLNNSPENLTVFKNNSLHLKIAHQSISS
jgi:hypothetical protein